MIREKEWVAEAQKKAIGDQAKKQALADWEKDDLARQILHDVWHENMKSDRVKGLIKMNKTTEKKEQKMGLKLTFGNYVITSTEPSQYTVTFKESKQCYFPSLEMAAQYVQTHAVLNSGLITTLDGFIAANKAIHDKISLAFDGLPF